MAFEDLLDPELRAGYLALPIDPDRILRPQSARAAMPDMLAARHAGITLPLDVEIAERMVPGPDGQVRIRLVRPRSRRDGAPALLWTHGGGYVMGQPEQDEPTLAAWASELGCVIVAPAYRLAPEHPHPAPVEDCYAAYAWLRGQAGALGVDLARVAVGGASAGGGLAAALAQMARDRGQGFCFQLLVCPMLDDRCETASVRAISDPRVWNGEKNRQGWEALLGERRGAREPAPYAVPGRAETLHGLPPACIVVSTLDPLVDEDIAYASRLMAAGVPTELHVHPGAFHGFHVMVPTAGVSRRANAEIADALARALGVGRPTQ